MPIEAVTSAMKVKWAKTPLRNDPLARVRTEDGVEELLEGDPYTYILAKGSTKTEFVLIGRELRN